MAETQKPEADRPGDPSHYAESSARENLVEHVFLGELLRGLWRKNVRDLEVLRPEVDNGGYDLALDFNQARQRGWRDGSSFETLATLAPELLAKDQDEGKQIQASW